MDLQRGFRIGEWTVRPNTGEISDGDQVQRLEPKVMQVLVALASQAEDVFLRDALLTRVWGERAAVADEPLTRCIAQLRLAFGDSARNSRVIETLPKRGYRLLQPVKPLEDASSITEPANAAARDQSAGNQRLPWRPILAAAAAGCILFAGAMTQPNLRLSMSVYFQPAVGTRNEEALKYYNEAVSLMSKRSYPNLRDAIYFLDQAIERDPTFARAYIRNAEASVVVQYYASSLGAEEKRFAQARLAEVERLINEGLIAADGDEALNETALWILAFIEHTKWNWLQAEIYFSRALAATPQDPDMLQRFASFLTDIGHLEEAQERAREAMEADPKYALTHDRYAITHLWLGDYEGATTEFARLKTKFELYTPNPDAQLILAMVNQDWPSVEILLSRLKGRIGAEEFDWDAALLAALKDPGNQPAQDLAAQIIDGAWSSGRLPARYVFGAWIFLGQWERALQQARAMAQDPAFRDQLDLEILFSDLAKDLRALPEFEDLLNDIGLISYWRQSAATGPLHLGWPTVRCMPSSDSVDCA